ncbi:hypothetical protein DFH06DRAFT_1376123 [Mycena polygramma]|nr:hypothetical protein DFH06DRAFT_1376123 [Mycena polygramma]
MSAAESPHIPDPLLDPNYTHPSSAGIPGIPQNWHESWDMLHKTLKILEECGFSPYAAVSGLLHAEIIYNQVSTLDSSSVDFLKPHLGTNYVPTVVEREAIKLYVAQGKERLTELSALLNVDRNRLLNSYGRVAALNELIDPYVGLASPIRIMPPEILQEIFVACLPTRHFPIMEASYAPLLLGRVCRTWRTISLSTPVLWSAVHVVVQLFGDSGQDLIQELCGKLLMWLQRSGDCPLFISIGAIRGSDEPDSDLTTMLDIIKTYSRRLKALKVPSMASRSGIHSILSNLAPPELPSLEVLDISEDYSLSADSVTLQLLPGLPNLHNLSLRYSWTADVSIPPCSWARFTSLCLESELHFFSLNASQLMELVAQCVNLNNCRLAFPRSVDHDGVPFPTSTATLRQTALLHLRTLAVRGDFAVNALFNVAGILDALTLPALRELRLQENHASIRPSSSVCDMFVATNELMDRSSCEFRELIIDFRIGDVEALLQCLYRSSSLTMLGLRRPRLPPPLPDDQEVADPVLEVADLVPILRALTNTLESTPLCPNLRHLRLVDCDSTLEFPSIARALIESRCSLAVPGVARLDSVDLLLSSCRLPNSEEFAAAMYPSKVTITEPPVWHMDRACGIPYDERELNETFNYY